MGQKVNPIGLRLGVNRTWESRWFARKEDFGVFLHEDLAVRRFLKKRLKQGGTARIVIERPHKRCLVTIYTARPGMVIGKKGADIEKLRKEISKIVSDSEVVLNLVEVRKPEIEASLVADGLAQQLERRAAFRRAMKRSLQTAMRMGAKGCKIVLSGRLGGAEIARKEEYQEGSVPLHTLRADIDYGTAEALTATGILGVKVWIYKGEIMEHDPYARERRQEETGENRARSKALQGA